MPGGLLTDLYELNMAASYLRRGLTEPATFSLYVRTLQPERGFLVAAGLEACLEVLETFSFEEDDLSYLGATGFDDRAILQITLIAAWFNYINRVADALGVGRDGGAFRPPAK